MTLLWVPCSVLAGSITLPVTFVDGNTLSAAQLNQCFQTIYNDYNGNITNFNIANAANVALTKLALNPGVEAFLRLAGAGRTWSSGLTTDTVPQISFTSDGKLLFGAGGSAAQDVGWRRSAANTMQLFRPDAGIPNLDLSGATISGLGTIQPSSGGTGLTSVPTGNLLVGAGTSPMTLIAPGAAGGAVQSNGTSFVRVNNISPAGGGLGTSTLPTNGQVPIGSSGNYVPGSITGDGIGVALGAGTINLSNTSIPALQGCRASISSTAANPVDGTGTTVYLIADRYALIGNYNGTKWIPSTVDTVTPPSVAVPATTNTGYDLYSTDSAGAAIIGVNAWSNQTTPPTRGVQDGVTWTGVNTHRLIASFSTNGTVSTVPDNAAQRYLSNWDNTVTKALSCTQGSYSANNGAVLGPCNVNTTDGAGRFSMFLCKPQSINATGGQALGTGHSSGFVFALGINSTTTASNPYPGNAPTTGTAGTISTSVATRLAAGLNTVQTLESASGSNSVSGVGATSTIEQ